MSDEIAHVAPFVVPPPVVQQPAIEKVPEPAPIETEHLRAVDMAFVQSQEKTDQVIGLMGLSVAAPWLLDILSEPFRRSAREEEEESHPHPKKLQPE